MCTIQPQCKLRCIPPPPPRCRTQLCWQVLVKVQKTNCICTWMIKISPSGLFRVNTVSMPFLRQFGLFGLRNSRISGGVLSPFLRSRTQTDWSPPLPARPSWKLNVNQRQDQVQEHILAWKSTSPLSPTIQKSFQVNNNWTEISGKTVFGSQPTNPKTGQIKTLFWFFCIPNTLSTLQDYSALK